MVHSASIASLLVALVVFGVRGAPRALGEGPAPKAPAVPAPVVVGQVSSGDAVIDRDLGAGLELALLPVPPPGPPAFVVRLGQATPDWGSAAESAVDLVCRAGALALVAPPVRATGHLLAQVGTRMRVPVLSTCGAPSVTGSGSRWVVRVVAAGPDDSSGQPLLARSPAAERFVAAYAARFGRLPTVVSAAGYDAGQALRLALQRSTGRGGSALKDGLLGLTSIPGAAGPFDLSAAGQRLDGGAPAQAGRSPPP